MTIDQFIKKLSLLRDRKTGKRLAWKVRPLRVNTINHEYCPITAVYKAETGEFFYTGAGFQGAYWMKLSDIDAKQIMYVSDRRLRDLGRLSKEQLCLLDRLERAATKGEYTA
jgi:hypothetical protein